MFDLKAITRLLLQPGILPVFLVKVICGFPIGESRAGVAGSSGVCGLEFRGPWPGVPGVRQENHLPSVRPLVLQASPGPRLTSVPGRAASTSWCRPGHLGQEEDRRQVSP